MQRRPRPTRSVPRRKQKHLLTGKRTLTRTRRQSEPHLHILGPNETLTRTPNRKPSPGAQPLKFCPQLSPCQLFSARNKANASSSPRIFHILGPLMSRVYVRTLESDSKVRYITSREDMKRGITREGGRPGLVATKKSCFFLSLWCGQDSEHFPPLLSACGHRPALHRAQCLCGQLQWLGLRSCRCYVGGAGAFGAWFV